MNSAPMAGRVPSPGPSLMSTLEAAHHSLDHFCESIDALHDRIGPYLRTPPPVAPAKDTGGDSRPMSRAEDCAESLIRKIEDLDSRIREMSDTVS